LLKDPALAGNGNAGAKARANLNALRGAEAPLFHVATGLRVVTLRVDYESSFSADGQGFEKIKSAVQGSKWQNTGKIESAL
jgi:hypothetical protein